MAQEFEEFGGRNILAPEAQSPRSALPVIAAPARIQEAIPDGRDSEE